MISDHQPYLFGHAGYWRKLFVNSHVVIADILYRPEDKLTACVGPDGLVFSAMLTKGVGGEERIADMRLTKASKLRTSIEQNLMNRYCQFGHRFEAFRDILEDGLPYMTAWTEMVRAMAPALGISCNILISTQRPEGLTTFERNLNRVKTMIGDRQLMRYMCGPNVRQYYQPQLFDADRMFVVQARSPSPVSMAWRVAREESPDLGEFDVSPLNAGAR